MRLNLFIAKTGFASRRKADSLIKEGKVTINGSKVLESFFEVSSSDKVKIGNKLLEIMKHYYVILNKPQGVTTTLKDKFAEKKITELLPTSFKGLYPVGRLDKNSSGLIILTNDGDLCYKLTHPSFLVEKEYLVKLKGLLGPGDCKKAKQGLDVKGDLLKLDSVNILKKEKDYTLCKVVAHEGKKRHLRRLFKALGFDTLELRRIRIGRLTLGNLAQAKFKVLSKDKIYALTGA